MSFKDIEGGEFYYPAFRESAIEPVLRKFGPDPSALYGVLERFGGGKVGLGDAAVEIETFGGLYIRVIIWARDEELPAEATMLYDKGITALFSMEDIVVLSRIVAHRL